MKLSLFLCVGLFTLFTLSACEGCYKKIAENSEKVISCRVFNNQPELCGSAIQKDDRACQYNQTTKRCEASSIVLHRQCAQLSVLDCKASNLCSYSEAAKKCIDAGPEHRGRCQTIELPDPCNNNIACIWNELVQFCQERGLESPP